MTTLLGPVEASHYLSMMAGEVSDSLEVEITFENLYSYLRKEWAFLFTVDEGAGFFIYRPDDDAMILDLIYSRTPGVIKRHIDFVDMLAMDVGVKTITCTINSPTMQRLARRYGFVGSGTEFRKTVDYGKRTETSSAQ